MKKLNYIVIFFTLLAQVQSFHGQTGSPAPYCNGGYTSGSCLQGGPNNTLGNSVNDFIDIFTTTGANTNINNSGSGCNMGPNNYINYCQHYLAVTPGQTITCLIQSGIIFSQGFAIWIDWDQNNTFANPGERVAATSNVPSAGTPTTLTFVIPLLQPPGVYRMRVRCAFATPGTNITPCGTFGFGETEDYNIIIGPMPPNLGVPTGTAIVNSPVCVGQALSFSVQTTYTAPLSYTWTGPNSFTSTLPNPIITSASLTATGNYSVIISNSFCPITRTVSALVVAYPSYTLVPPSATVCQGGITTGSMVLAGNPSQFSFLWSGPGTIFNASALTTLIQPPLQPANVQVGTVSYTVVVSPTITSCPISAIMPIAVYNPVLPTFTLQAPLCNISAPVQLLASPGGGTWSANPAVSPSGFFSPSSAAIGNNTVTYAVSIGSCLTSNTSTLLVSQFHTAALGSVLSQKCVQDAPIRLMNLPQDTLTGSWSGPSVSNNYFNPAGLASGIYNLTYSTVSSNLNYSTISLPNPNTCPSSTVMAVTVFNPPIPTITNINPACSNSSTIALTANPSAGVWSGNAGVSPIGIQTPSLNLIGTNTLTYTAGQGTCVAASSKTFHVSKFNSAALTGTVPHLCATSNPYNLLSIVQYTSGLWSGVNVNNGSTFNPSGLSTAVYTLTYNTTSSPNPTLCPDTRTVGASVLNPPMPNIAQAGPFCSIHSGVQMTVSPSTGTWIPSPFLNNIGIFSPSLSAVGSNMVQYAIGTNTCNTIQTIYVRTEGFVTAKILGNVPDLCNNNSAVSLGPLTANNLGTWSGPGVVGSSFNPAVTNAGIFNLLYTTASSPSGLCPDADTLAVKVFSLASPVINDVGPFCNSFPPIQLQVSPVGGLFGASNNGAINNEGLFKPASAAIGNNLVSYSISAGPCIAYTQATINVQEFISADFEKPVALAYCRNHVAFDLNSLVKNPGGFWSGPGVTGSMFNPGKANSGENNFIVYQTFSKPIAQLCADTSAVRIRVKEIPNVTANSNKYSGCEPLEVVLNSPNYTSGFGNWSIDDGSESESGFLITHIFTKSGSYQVVYNYSDGDAEGCTAQYILPTFITVYPKPQADFAFEPGEVSISNPEVVLTNLTRVLGDNTYRWNIQGFGESTLIHPTVNFTKMGLFRVTLTATDFHGCEDAVTKYIDVKNDFNVFIPNSFTPNFDGLNDVFIPVFTPFGLDSKSYQLEIYDRWGHIIFTSKEPKKGWDGTFQNQGTSDIKEGNYVYKLKYKDLDGHVYDQTGTVNLTR